jgi:hypothetical protein
LRLAAASGFAMTLLCVVLSIFPIISVPNRLTFTLKVSGTVIASNGLAVLIYWFQTRLSRSTAVRHAGHLEA